MGKCYIKDFVRLLVLLLFVGFYVCFLPNQSKGKVITKKAESAPFTRDLLYCRKCPRTQQKGATPHIPLPSPRCRCLLILSIFSTGESDVKLWLSAGFS